MFAEFGVELAAGEDEVVVAVQGDVDVYSAPQFQAALEEVIEGGGRRVVVDLGQLDFMDARGIAALLRVEKRLARQGGRLALRSPPSIVCRLLEITGAGEVLPVEPRR